MLWLNYPNNPTAATAPLDLYERAAALAREHGFVLACDEAYSELWFAGDPPASALQVADRTNVAVFNTLSKRSSMPGYRSGFVAGDPELIAALKRYRPNVGVAPPEFVQRAAARGVGRRGARRARCASVYRAKRDVAPARRCEARGLRPRAATRRSSSGCGRAADERERLLERGLVVAPGDFLGAAARATCGWRSCRRSSECERAAELLVRVQRRVEAAPRAAARQRLDRARSASCGGRAGRSAPLSSRALTTSPSGSATRVPAVT